MAVKRCRLYAKDSTGNLYQVQPEGPYSTYQGATNTHAGVEGFVPAANTEAWNKFLRGDGAWVEVSGGSGSGGGGGGSVPIYQGATESATGVTGTVPAATASEVNKFLRGDGTWAGIQIDSVGVYEGATDSASGVPGTVPAADPEEKDMFLKGDGTWALLESVKNVAIMDETPTEQNTGDTANESIIFHETGSTIGSEYTPVYTSGNQAIAGVKNFASGIYTGVSSVSDGDIDVTLGGCFTKIVSADTVFTFTGAPEYACTCFTLILENGGSHSVTWPSSVRWDHNTAPTLTSDGIDVLEFLTDNGGSRWFGFARLLGAAH